MTAAWGPVTQPLVDELRELVVAKVMVVWLDRAGHYTDFFDRLGDDSRALGARLVGYRGSYLELLARLAELTDGADRRPLVLHVPGANKETIKDTPLLQIYEASYPYERALDTLVRTAAAGRIPPEDVDAFLRSGGVGLAHADAWLAARSATAGDALAAELRAKAPGVLIADLLHHRSASHEDARAGQAQTVRHALAARFGLPADWPAHRAATTTTRALAETAAEWVMAVEYVHDLRRPPRAELLLSASKLAPALVNACRKAAAHLRDHLPEDYKTLAQDFEERLGKEVSEGTADELGKIDTFSFEEDRLLQDALDALRGSDWPRAQRWADERLDGGSVWLRLDPTRDRTWRLLRRCAELGQAIDASETGERLAFDRMRSLDEAVATYAERGAAVDRLHRQLEQTAATDLLERLPHAQRVEAAVGAVRQRWRAWAEARARAWSELTRREGALPSPPRQQRTIFEDVVAPMLRDGDKTAYFVVDAMRFEMAQELRDLIGRPPGSRVHLQARLCELPAVTEVGMNVLAPLARRGRLHPKLDDKRQKIRGWRDGTTSVAVPAERAKAIDARLPGSRCRWLSLEDVIATVDPSRLKRKIRDAPLVVVHSRQIDNAGEHGSGLSEFSRELRRLEKARQLLRAAGVRRFAITSDHGFLIRDPAEATLTFGKVHDSKGRYALYGQPFANEDTYSVSLTSLDYDDGRDDVLVFPKGLQVFESARARDYVHGGNSPQERVIPVLTVEHKRQQGSAEDQHYRIAVTEEILDPRGHRIEARVERTDNQVSLPLAAEAIPIELRAIGGSNVRVDLLEARDATLEGGMVTVQTGQAFAVTFRLVGAREQRLAVRLTCATADVQVDDTVSRARFDVVVLGRTRPMGELAHVVDDEAAASTDAPDADAWLEAYEEPGVRKVMAHIATHGEVTEADLHMLLGSPRDARRFARKYEEYAKAAPFLLTIVNTASGKAYRKLTDG